MFAGENLPDWTPGSQWFGYWIDRESRGEYWINRVSAGENPLWQGKMFISNLFLPADTPNDQRLRDVLEVTGKVMRNHEAISKERRNRP